MFLAVILDRPAIAMRNVALTALVLLVLTPESLLDVGFQMSFAAVVSLVALYEAIRGTYWGRRTEVRGPVATVTLFFFGIVVSTLVASVAVAPFAAYHFHKSQQFAVLANLVAIPICNLVVMPAGLVTLVLMPFGLEWIPLALMGWGIDAVSATAHTVATMPGAVGHIPAIPSLSLGVMVFGGLWLTLWRSRWRILGLAVFAAGLALTPMEPRPDLIVGRAASAVALRTPGGQLTLLPGRHASFQVKRWLEHDGDARSPEEAAKEQAFVCDGVGCTGRLGERIVAVSRHPASLADDCARAHVLVSRGPVPEYCKSTDRGPEIVIDGRTVAEKGTHVIYGARGGRRLRLERVADVRGTRPWTIVPSPKRSGARRDVTAPAKTIAGTPEVSTAHDSDSSRSGNSLSDLEPGFDEDE
jgi:competence protein ComEC